MTKSMPNYSSFPRRLTKLPFDVRKRIEKDTDPLGARVLAEPQGGYAEIYFRRWALVMETLLKRAEMGPVELR